MIHYINTLILLPTNQVNTQGPRPLYSIILLYTTQVQNKLFRAIIHDLNLIQENGPSGGIRNEALPKSCEMDQTRLQIPCTSDAGQVW